METKEKVLYHQIHPAKLSTDIAAAVASTILFWLHFFWIGLAVNLAPPIVASLLIVRFVNLERIRESAAGAYLRRNMTPAAQAVRFAGNVVMLAGAWFQSVALLAISVLVIALGWTWGLIRPKRDG